MLPAFVLFSAIWSEPSQQVTTKEEEEKEEGSTSDRFR